MGNLGTPGSQRTLVDLASRSTLPFDLRMAAVESFRTSVEHFGILLTTTQVTRQYERYNESERLDASTQRVLGLLLDCIEARTDAGGVETQASLA